MNFDDRDDFDDYEAEENEDEPTSSFQETMGRNLDQGPPGKKAFLGLYSTHIMNVVLFGISILTFTFFGEALGGSAPTSEEQQRGHMDGEDFGE
jgi:hypothetical protein